jgi:hypothetical protein
MFFTGKVKSATGRIRQEGKGMDRETAAAFVSEKLKYPSFIYEADNANEAFREAYGMDYASPSEMRIMSDREKIARLEAELEKVQIEKRQAAMGLTEIGPPTPMEEYANADVAVTNAIGDTDNAVVGTKEDFLAANPGLKGLPGHRAWNRYAREHGIEIVK